MAMTRKNSKSNKRVGKKTKKSSKRSNTYTNYKLRKTRKNVKGLRKMKGGVGKKVKYDKLETGKIYTIEAEPPNRTLKNNKFVYTPLIGKFIENLRTYSREEIALNFKTVNKDTEHFLIDNEFMVTDDGTNRYVLVEESTPESTQESTPEPTPEPTPTPTPEPIPEPTPTPKPKPTPKPNQEPEKTKPNFMSKLAFWKSKSTKKKVL
jgi:hypothetical protein